jgi:signal transduction histidine kinase
MLSENASFSAEDMTLSNIISRELDRIEQLVNEMLDYTRPKRPNRSRLDLVKTINEIIVAFNNRKDEDGIEIIVHYEEPVIVSVDKNQLIQVIWNLLRNAAQAAGEGGQIEIFVYYNIDKRAQLDVCDNGPGIPDDKKSIIFDPFYSTKEQGMGLGLSICKRIIDDHKGKIYAGQSQMGGAQISIELPIE